MDANACSSDSRLGLLGRPYRYPPGRVPSSALWKVVERWMAGTTSRDPPSGLRPAWTARVSIFIAVRVHQWPRIFAGVSATQVAVVAVVRPKREDQRVSRRAKYLVCRLL